MEDEMDIKAFWEKHQLIIMLCLLVILVPTFAFADLWCMWDGSQGTSCQSDGRGYIIVPSGFKVSTESIANAAGYYRVVTTDPVLGENQVRDQEVWGFSSNEITRTWTVRDLTASDVSSDSEVGNAVLNAIRVLVGEDVATETAVDGADITNIGQGYPVWNFIASDKAFNFNASSIFFNHNARNKDFYFNAKAKHFNYNATDETFGFDAE